MKTLTDCPTCGYHILCVWNDDVKWTGRCESCGTLVMFGNKEDVRFVKAK